MNELKLAEKLVSEANSMIAERDQMISDLYVYKAVINHGHGNALRNSRAEWLKKKIDELQEEIDYRLSFAQNIVERAAA